MLHVALLARRASLDSADGVGVRAQLRLHHIVLHRHHPDVVHGAIPRVDLLPIKQRTLGRGSVEVVVAVDLLPALPAEVAVAVRARHLGYPTTITTSVHQRKRNRRGFTTIIPHPSVRSMAMPQLGQGFDSECRMRRLRAWFSSSINLRCASAFGFSSSSSSPRGVLKEESMNQCLCF